MRYRADKDFAVIMEFHDDLAICDSSTLPNAISFVQIKTKRRERWTMKSLCKQSSRGGSSILRRMFDTYHLHSENVACTCVLTGNAHINFGKDHITSGDGACSISGESLSSQVVETVCSNLDLSEDQALEFLAATTFDKHILPLESCSTQTLGLISELLSEKCVAHLDAMAFQAALLSEIRLRAACISTSTTVDELLTSKSLRPQDITEFLAQAESKQASRTSLVEDIKAQIRQEDLGWNEQTIVRTALFTCDARLRMGDSLYHEYLNSLPSSVEPLTTLYNTAIELEKSSGNQSSVSLQSHRLALCLIHLFSVTEQPQ